MHRGLGTYTEEDVARLAQEAYQTGEATFPLDLRQAALLVIDMQEEFVRPHWTAYWVPDATRMVPRLATLLAAARRAGLPIIHTAFAATHQRRDRPFSGKFMPNRYHAFSYDELLVEAHFEPELMPTSGEIVLLKPSYGAFYDTALDTILRNLACDTVIITGTMTNLCCGTTARQAYERGYKVVFGSDVTATNDPALHQAELKTLRYGFARVMSAAEIITLLEGISQ
jgi:nicotinamidase-related amidase